MRARIVSPVDEGKASPTRISSSVRRHRDSPRSPAQRAHIEREKIGHGRFGSRWKVQPVSGPTESWWLKPDFYAHAKAEQARIQAASRGKAE